MVGGVAWHITARFASWWVEAGIGILLLDLPLGRWKYALAYYCSIFLLADGGRDWQVTARFAS